MLADALRSAGYEVALCQKASECEAQVQKGPVPHLVVTSILLPDLDGLSVCEILRRQPSTKKIPIIIMSALSGDVTKRTTIMQAEDFFTKPLDLNRLERRIAELLHTGAAVN